MVGDSELAVVQTGKQDDLDERFGPVQTVQGVKPGELQHWPRSRERLDAATGAVLRSYMQIALDGVKISTVLHSTIPILWAVSAEGDLWFAIEEVVDTNTATFLFPFARGLKTVEGQATLGHPAVVGSKSARIGGELLFDAALDPPSWVLNNKSGRFGYGADRVEQHLKNVSAVLASHNIHPELDYIPPKPKS